MLFLLAYVRPYWYVLDMAHIHKKMKKGRPYYYVREIARVDGKPKVINQVYLIRPAATIDSRPVRPASTRERTNRG